MDVLIGISIGFALGIATGGIVAWGIQKNLISGKISKYIKEEEIIMQNRQGQKVQLKELLASFDPLHRS